MSTRYTKPDVTSIEPYTQSIMITFNTSISVLNLFLSRVNGVRHPLIETTAYKGYDERGNVQKTMPSPISMRINGNYCSLSTNQVILVCCNDMEDAIYRIQIILEQLKMSKMYDNSVFEGSLIYVTAYRTTLRNIKFQLPYAVDVFLLNELLKGSDFYGQLSQERSILITQHIDEKKITIHLFRSGKVNIKVAGEKPYIDEAFNRFYKFFETVLDKVIITEN